MTQPIPALKEWAVLIAALGQGRQIVTIRKGGIREETKDFRVRHEAFLLYPTYDHQQADLLKPEYRADLAAVLAAGVDPAREVVISHYAQVTDAFETSSDAIVRALGPHHIFSDDYAEKRLHWRPRKPLEVMLLRVYALARPQRLAVVPEYGGCKSWIELPGAIALDGMTPVLEDAAYARRADPVRVLFAAGVAS
ncbi:MAG TPA: DUF1802 family protein [Ktedonobacterales bacterium]